MLKFIYVLCLGITPFTLTMRKEPTYLGLLPTDILTELKSYRMEDLLRQISMTTNRQYLIPLVEEFKAALDSMNNELKRSISLGRLKNLFKAAVTHLALTLDDRDFNTIEKKPGFFKNTIQHWKDQECQLIQACLNGDLEKVKQLIEENNVDPYLPFLIFLHDSSCASKLNISSKLVPVYNYAMDNGHDNIADYIFAHSKPFTFNLGETYLK